LVTNMKKYRLNKRGKMQLIVIMLLVTIFCLLHVNKVCAESKIGTAYYAYRDETNNLVAVESELPQEEVKEFTIELNEQDIEILANVLYGEARGIKDKAHQAAVIWCILNRVDNNRFPDTIYEVVSAPNQFYGYNPNRSYTKQTIKQLEDCKELARDVMYRYYKEKAGFENVGRTLPDDYYFFYGKNGENHFTKEWRKYDTLWKWELESPYVED